MCFGWFFFYCIVEMMKENQFIKNCWLRILPTSSITLFFYVMHNQPIEKNKKQQASLVEFECFLYGKFVFLFFDTLTK